MSGYAVAMGECWSCGRPFAFNPHRVPSIEGEPVCGDCIAAANAIRAARGLPPIEILDGAYEPLDEGEL